MMTGNAKQGNRGKAHPTQRRQTGAHSISLTTSDSVLPSNKPPSQSLQFDFYNHRTTAAFRAHRKHKHLIFPNIPSTSPLEEEKIQMYNEVERMIVLDAEIQFAKPFQSMIDGFCCKGYKRWVSA